MPLCRGVTQACVCACAVCVAEVRSAETIGPVLIHVITEKGHGYEPAEVSQDKMHGVVKFDPKTGKQFAVGGCALLWSGGWAELGSGTSVQFASGGCRKVWVSARPGVILQEYACMREVGWDARACDVCHVFLRVIVEVHAIEGGRAQLPRAGPWSSSKI